MTKHSKCPKALKHHCPVSWPRHALSATSCKRKKHVSVCRTHPECWFSSRECCYKCRNEKEAKEAKAQASNKK